MEKKNSFITTIGFKKDDPDHVYVAKLLNTLGRGKAQFIVKAVLDEREEKMVRGEKSVTEQKAEKENDALSKLDEDAINGIMASIAAFQQQ